MQSVAVRRAALLREWPLAALIAVLASTGGCGIDVEYLVPQVIGQADILLGAVPIQKAIESGSLSEEERGKLLMLLDARRFARDVIGLDTRDSYTSFYDTGDGPVAYNVSACAKHVFVPKLWTFPIVGTVPYLGYFEWSQAARKVNELTAQGYDVFYYEIDAYSTIDYLPNPVFSSMLRRNALSMVDTVLHELLHSTVWHSSSTTFNESLATFVGRTGAIDFFADRFPDDPELVEIAAQWYEDMDRYNEFISELHLELDAFYSTDVIWSERLEGREAVYQAGRDRFVAEVLPRMNEPESFKGVAELPTNNAWILANVRYNRGMDLFEQIHEENGRDWRASLSVFRAAARSADPYAYLQAWLDGESNAPASTDSQLESQPAPAAKSLTDTDSESVSGRGPCPKPTWADSPPHGQGAAF